MWSVHLSPHFSKPTLNIRISSCASWMATPMPELARARGQAGCVGVQFQAWLVIAIEREAPMPVYDYVCNDCHETFELILTLKEHEVDTKCPKCGSKHVEQEATAFYAVTGKKS